MHSQPDILSALWERQTLSNTNEPRNADHIPCEPVRLDRSGVLDNKTQLPVFNITVETAHATCFGRGNTVLSVTHSTTKALLGTVRLPKPITAICRLSINGCDTALMCSRLQQHWKFKATSLDDHKWKRISWYWKRDRPSDRSFALVDAKQNGSILARIDRDMLVFEQVGLSNKALGDIIVSAVALAELARRNAGNSDVNDLGQSIGDIVLGHQKISHGGHRASHHKAHHRSYHSSSHHGAGAGGAIFAGIAASGDGGGGGGGGMGCGGGDGGGGGGGGGGGC
jgi:hypothetical protein